jgi:hypothetical protein
MTSPQSVSPDGRFEILTDAWEAGNSHWVETPSIRDRISGEPIPSFTDNSWSLDESLWCSGSIVRLTLRKYPGNHEPSSVMAIVDCAARTAITGGGRSVPLHAIESALEAEMTWR